MIDRQIDNYYVPGLQVYVVVEERNSVVFLLFQNTENTSKKTFLCSASFFFAKC